MASAKGIEVRVLCAGFIGGVSFDVNDVVECPPSLVAPLDGEVVDSAKSAVEAALTAGGQRKQHPALAAWLAELGTSSEVKAVAPAAEVVPEKADAEAVVVEQEKPAAKGKKVAADAGADATDTAV